MHLCLTQAAKGFGHVSPNPMVGCVIVHNDTIVAASYHKVYGGPHAEVNAIHQMDSHDVLKNSTVYVSLEPCAHHGKTPPCASLLIEKQVKKVVIATTDPYPEVSGKGIQMLRDAGIEVVSGVLEKEARVLNKRFFINHTQHRPYVILKWAESADGYMAHPEIRQISGADAQVLLHRWRSEEDAFLIGTNTLLFDNPHLNTRLYKGKDPIRIAIDMDLKSEGQSLNFYTGEQTTIILNGIKDKQEGALQLVQIPDNSIPSILNVLQKLKIGSVVVEGGAQLLNSFIEAGVYDEVRKFTSKSLVLSDGIKAPKLQFIATQSIDLETDTLSIYLK